MNARMFQKFTAVVFGWWVEQLAGLLPASWLNIFAKSSDAAILELEDENFVLWIRRNGGSVRTSQGAIGDLKAALAHVAHLPHLLLLRVSPKQALCKTLSLPGAARRELKNLLGFEIDRETPFEQAEVYWSYLAGPLDKGRGKLDVDLVVVPHPVADAAVAAARDAGFDPAALEVDVATDRSVLIWVAAQQPVQQILLYRKFKPAVSVTCAVLAAFVIVSFAGLQLNLFLANRAIADLQERSHEASLLRQAANRRTASIAFLSKAQGTNENALGILAAATHTLPDDTYLTSFSVHDGHVTITGYSDSAANLIGLLAKAPAFREPVFDSPVTESQDSDQEKFSISMALAPMGAL
jgi:general secretion pathway protein L